VDIRWEGVMLPRIVKQRIRKWIRQDALTHKGELSGYGNWLMASYGITEKEVQFELKKTKEVLSNEKDREEFLD
jgi:hypothetical protein